MWKNPKIYSQLKNISWNQVMNLSYQCKNWFHGILLIVFLPLRFSVKSNSANWESLNSNCDHFGGSEFRYFFSNFSFGNMQKFTKTNIYRCWNCQNSWFWDSKLTNIDFTENLYGRKISKFPHCAMYRSQKHVLDVNLGKYFFYSSFAAFLTFYVDFCTYFCDQGKNYLHFLYFSSFTISTF